MVYSKEEIKLSILKVVEVFTSILECNSSLVLRDEKILNISQLQSLYTYKFSNELDKVISSYILEYITKCEVKAPLSSLEMLEHVKKYSLNKDSGYIKNSLKNILDDNSTCLSHVATKEQFFSIVESINFEYAYIRDMVKDAIQLAGFAGNIAIEKTNKNDHIELIDGYTFECNSSVQKPIKIKNSLILCIDGIIQNISEIHHILEFCNESKNSLIIFSRGFSDDVINTLSVNRNRGSLNVYDAKINFDIESANTLVDICVVSNSNLVSSLKGDLITSVIPQELSRVDEAILSNQKCLIKNSSTKHAVKQHVQRIKLKRSESIDDVQKVLDKRIKSLISNNVIIRIKDDLNYVSKSQIIDYILRIFKSICDYGIIVENEKLSLYANFFFSKYYAYKLINSFNEIGCVIR